MACVRVSVRTTSGSITSTKFELDKVSLPVGTCSNNYEVDDTCTIYWEIKGLKGSTFVIHVDGGTPNDIPGQLTEGESIGEKALKIDGACP